MGLYPAQIRTMYLWECAVILGVDEVDDSGPAPTESGLHRDPVFASSKGGLGFGALKVEGVTDG